MGKSQRNKGAGGEREWVKILQEHGLDAQRNLNQSRDGGLDVTAQPFGFEVKRRASFKTLRGFLDQATMAKVDWDVRIRAVALREDGRTDWMILMTESDFFRLVANTRQMGHNLPKLKEIDMTKGEQI